MNTSDFKRDDWIVIGLAVVLVIDLLALPWYSASSFDGFHTNISYTSVATGYPNGWAGVLAFLLVLAVGADLVVERLSPKTTIPNIGGSRTLTRWWLTVAAGVLLALKLVLHIGDFGFGFFLAVVLTAGLLYATFKLSKDQPVLPSQSGPASV